MYVFFQQDPFVSPPVFFSGGAFLFADTGTPSPPIKSFPVRSP